MTRLGSTQLRISTVPGHNQFSFSSPISIIWFFYWLSLTFRTGRSRLWDKQQLRSWHEEKLFWSWWSNNHATPHIQLMNLNSRCISMIFCIDFLSQNRGDDRNKNVDDRLMQILRWSLGNVCFQLFRWRKQTINEEVSESATRGKIKLLNFLNWLNILTTVYD